MHRIDYLHRLNKSRGQRIIWLLEELKLSYEIKVYKRAKDRRAPPSLKEIHPLGKSPAITIEAPGLNKPLALAESGPIVEYLCEHFGRQLIPQRYPDGKDGVIGAETEEWLRYRVSPIFVFSVALNIPSRIRKGRRISPFIRDGTANSRLLAVHIEATLYPFP